MDLTDAIKNTISVSRFRTVPAEEIFAEVRKCGAKIVIKDDQPECILLSPAEYIKLYDGVHELFDAIRKNGGKIYLLSNAQRIFTEPEIRMMGIYDDFEYVMISSDEGCAKPDRKFYECMLNRFNLDPKETIMIGNDYITDIKGSYEAGIDSLYLHTNISPEINGELLAKYKIMSGSLEEAREVLFGTPGKKAGTKAEAKSEKKAAKSEKKAEKKA